jgi:suppressor for copper-sensitivity B
MAGVLSGAGLGQAAVYGDMSGRWVGDPAIAKVRLVSAVTGTSRLERLPLGLEFHLGPGWKIYWRTPGEAGLPPSLTLGLADGTTLKTDISWPVPQRFDAFGFDNFGYADYVILPVSISGFSVGAPQQIRGRIEALVCKEICVPLAEDVDLDLADGPASPSLYAREIAQFAARVPRPGGASGIPMPTVTQVEDTLLLDFGSTGPAIDEIFVEGLDGTAFKKPVYADGVAQIAMTDAPASLAGQSLDLTIVAGADFRSVRVQVAAAADTDAGDRAMAGAAGQSPFWLVLGLAFLGGIILNLMPCVLPVLAIKLASIVESSGLRPGLVRLRFLSGAAGIQASFMLLALGLATARFAGGQVGWGVQFQSPLFLGFMMLVVGLFMLMMLDRLLLPIPTFAQSLVGRSDDAERHPLAADFIAGMLATLLATPCSAPFVGGAVSVALTGDTAQLFGVFAAMGAGLAAPWLLVAAMPGLVGCLPRPGRWMVWLKRGLAGLLLATLVWLGYLMLVVQEGLAGLVGVGAVLVVLSGAAAGRRWIGLAGGVVGGLALLAATVMWSDDGQDRGASLAKAASWRPWSHEATARALDAGKLVLVDVTADWCITCKANKALVLERAPVADEIDRLVKDGRLVLLQADWTRPDDGIAAFLASHDRFGIPFNIIYGPAAPDGIVLGELLTGTMVLHGLARAGTAP